MAHHNRTSQDKAQIEAQVKNTITSFQGEMTGMLNQISETMEELKKSGFTNAGHLNKEYGKGYSSIQVQMKKASEDVLAAYTKNFNELKANIKENYDGIYGQAKANIDKNMARFKASVPQVILNVPGPQQKIYQDLVKALEEASAKTLKDMENNYKDLITGLDKTFQEGIKAMGQTTGGGGHRSSITSTAGSVQEAPHSTSNNAAKKSS